MLYSDLEKPFFVNFVNFYNADFGETHKLQQGKFLRDSLNICTIKSFLIMDLKEGMT